jgi:hypothetical protein
VWPARDTALDKQQAFPSATASTAGAYRVGDVARYVIIRTPQDYGPILKMCSVFTQSFIHSSIALQPFVGPRSPFYSFLIIYTVGRIPWTGISPSQDLYLHTGQHKHRLNVHRHPCLEWDSNPRLHRSSGRRQFMP